MNKSKIVNDPVYGFINIPYGIIFDLVEHPYFQRLRRISQLGLTSSVYPGALHTRFQHVLGALHLTRQAIDVLISKGVEITTAEAEAVCIAILLHDIGHGPFSHALEHTLVDLHHEEISVLFMEVLNEEFNGALSLAIQVFKNEHSKKFLHQLVSSQLDMDRMDYLNRDCFFTGVHEGVIGYDRIIKMLDVVDGELVVEEKGIYSIEKFLIARRIMYWQVYLHKTAISIEQMLIHTLLRAKQLYQSGAKFQLSEELTFFLKGNIKVETTEDKKKLLQHFALLDDISVLYAIKEFAKQEDKILSFLAKSIINRKPFRIEIKNAPFKRDYLENIRQKVGLAFNIETENDFQYFIYQGSEANKTYNKQKDEIKIKAKSGKVKALSTLSDYDVSSKIIKKYFLCYPKNLV